ncbi:MAG: hypothetical protein ACYTDU_09625 [Planctomycetota bacterium]|jgi:hypothetical protein
MRRLVIFLAACGLGSLTVVGQDADDEDPNRALKAKIEQLSRELNARRAQRHAPERRRVFQRSYEVGDLCAPVFDEDLEPSNLFASGWDAPEREAPDERRTGNVDMIIEMIRMLVAPESWDAIEGADIQPRSTRILVTNIGAVHTHVPILLNQLRSYLALQVAVEVVAVPVPADVSALLASRPRELTRKETARLQALEPLGSVRLVCFDGQQVVQRSGRTRTYLADYAAKIAQNAALGRPVLAKVFSGCAVEVRGCLDRSGNGAILHCQFERTALGDPMASAKTAHGPLDLPEMSLTRLQTSLWVPLDKTVVAGGGTAGHEPCVFLVTARRVKPGG